MTTNISRRGTTEYREYYRFRRDGLFVLTRVSPDDITVDGQYVGSDRVLGIGTLVQTLTKMMAFAAALAHEYSDKTEAIISVARLANHKLLDDLADRPLTLGDIEPAHQDVVTTEFSGSAELFESEWRDFAADAISKCLRALNYPAMPNVTRETVRQLQSTKYGAYVCRKEADAAGDRDTRNGQ